VGDDGSTGCGHDRRKTILDVVGLDEFQEVAAQ
jgi:hypothetical protein